MLSSSSREGAQGTVIYTYDYKVTFFSPSTPMYGGHCLV